MNSNLILKSDVLDIVFEKRNKAYGAYVLRKFYGNRVKRALAIMILVAGGFMAFTFIPQNRNHIVGRLYEISGPELGKTDPPKPKEEPKKPEPPKPPVKQPWTAPPVNAANYTTNIKIVDRTVKTDSILMIDDKTIISNTNVVVTGSPNTTIPPTPPDPGTGKPEPVKVDPSVPLGLDAVDVPPSFPGGTEALLGFLRKHLNNPDEMASGESVSVKVTFVVGYEGKLKGFKITQDGGDIFNKEVIRVLKKMPDWVPGKAKGENVSVYYSIPVKFTGAD